MTEVDIRVAGAADAVAIADLRALWAGGAEEEPAFGQRLAAWLASEGDRRTTWLAILETRPVGMASLFEYRRMPKPGRADSCWGYIGNLFVRADARNRGIGSALLAALVTTADERGYARLVVSPSAEAQPLLRRYGFRDATGAELLLVRPAGD